MNLTKLLAYALSIEPGGLLLLAAIVILIIVLIGSIIYNHTFDLGKKTYEDVPSLIKTARLWLLPWRKESIIEHIRTLTILRIHEISFDVGKVNSKDDFVSFPEKLVIALNFYHQAIYLKHGREFQESESHSLFVLNPTLQEEVTSIMQTLLSYCKNFSDYAVLEKALHDNVVSIYNEFDEEAESAIRDLLFGQTSVLYQSIEHYVHVLLRDVPVQDYLAYFKLLKNALQSCISVGRYDLANSVIHQMACAYQWAYDKKFDSTQSEQAFYESFFGPVNSDKEQ